MRLPLRSPIIAAWLFVVALLIVVTIFVGGATRLTKSGLSITEWKPIVGVMPPMSEPAWQQEFDKYKQIPQFKKINSHMNVAAFKGIYWWEWLHRLMGHILAAVFFIPFIVFMLRSEMPARMIGRASLLFGLGALQAYLGWWMVKSGLDVNILVAPERLTLHLGMALLIFSLSIWFGLEAMSGESRGRGGPIDWRIASGFVFGLLVLQALLGGLVAGNEAGLVYNDWPLMNGSFVPYVDWNQGFGYVMLHDQGMVQFLHRMNAYIMLIYVTVFAIVLAQKCMDDDIKLVSTTIATLLWVQAGLGIITLVTSVNIFMALIHQITAIALIALASYLMWKIARADRDFR